MFNSLCLVGDHITGRGLLVGVDLFQVGRNLLNLLGQGNSSRTSKLLDSIRFQFPEELFGVLFVSGFLHHNVFGLDGQNPGIVAPDQVLHLIAVGESFRGYLV